MQATAGDSLDNKTLRQISDNSFILVPLSSHCKQSMQGHDTTVRSLWVYQLQWCHSGSIILQWGHYRSINCSEVIIGPPLYCSEVIRGPSCCSEVITSVHQKGECRQICTWIFGFTCVCCSAQHSNLFCTTPFHLEISNLFWSPLPSVMLPLLRKHGSGTDPGMNRGSLAKATRLVKGVFEAGKTSQPQD